MRRGLPLLLALAGCSGGLPSASEVNKLRVLAVRAEPPEVAPSQTSTLDTLTALPPLDPGATAPTVSYLWLACIEPPGSTAPGACGLSAQSPPPSGGFTIMDVSTDAGSTGTVLGRCADDPSAALCLIGEDATVSYAPSGVVIDPQVGSGQVILTVIVADEHAGGARACAQGAVGNGGAPPDPDHCVIAIKRLTVSHSATPNHNPTLTALTLGGTPLTDGSARWSTAVVNTGPAITVEATRAAGSAEVLSDGTHENLYVSWFASAGNMENSRTTFYVPSCDTTCMMQQDAPLTSDGKWDAPDAAGVSSMVHGGAIDFWAVVHDPRGGVSWLAGSATQK